MSRVQIIFGKDRCSSVEKQDGKLPGIRRPLPLLLLFNSSFHSSPTWMLHQSQYPKRVIQVHLNTQEMPKIIQPALWLDSEISVLNNRYSLFCTGIYNNLGSVILIVIK